MKKGEEGKLYLPKQHHYYAQVQNWQLSTENGVHVILWCTAMVKWSSIGCRFRLLKHSGRSTRSFLFCITLSQKSYLARYFFRRIWVVSECC